HCRTGARPTRRRGRVPPPGTGRRTVLRIASVPPRLRLDRTDVRGAPTSDSGEAGAPRARALVWSRTVIQPNVIQARDMTQSAATSSSLSGASGRWRIALWAVVAIAAIAGARYLDAPALFRKALDGVAGLGAVGLLLFVLLYVAAAVLFLPGSVLTLGAGAVFGLARGVGLVWIGATLGATAAFLVGRYLARDWVARRIDGNPRFRAIDEAVAREGWKIVLLTRLSPVFPFNLLN